MMPFHLLFPEIGIAETRTVIVPVGRPEPKGDYTFIEDYCVTPDCDCRQVVLNVYPQDSNDPLASIYHFFDEDDADPVRGQTFLDPRFPQARHSRTILDLFTKSLLADQAYIRRLEKHYRKVKRAVADHGHPVHARIANLKSPKSPVRPAAKKIRREEKPVVKTAPAPIVIEAPRIDIPKIDAIDVRERASDWTSLTVMLDSPGHPAEVFLRIDYERLKLQGEFDELLSPEVLPNIEKYWFQIETVRKVLRRFHGRVLLADEVGLGKTIEAGLLIKEYMMRGLAKRVLILAPASLVSQWKEEMRSKFDIDFSTTEGTDFARSPEEFWTRDLIIASLHTAKTRKNSDSVALQSFDIVVVDEAHHLRNRGTLAWQLVNRLQKRFLFLLSATPVQNNLVELFNLITLLKPGQFQTESVFRREYMTKGSDRKPANKEKLRELLRDVMIRNTRSAIDLKMTKRYATTIRLEPSQGEAAVLRELDILLRDGMERGVLRRAAVQLLLREAGSSPFALPGTLERMKERDSALAIEPVSAALDAMKTFAKGDALLELLALRPNEKVVIFAQFLKTMDQLASVLDRAGHGFVLFRGDMSGHEKDESVARFRGDVPILLASESGGEGRNLQFANTLVNFDLPWNPMRIEQRIGRIHRIGQTRDVFVFNFAVHGTIEDHVLEILESKINMFEMVIGEIEPILGRLSEKRGDESEFEDLIFDLWASTPDARERAEAFGKLGDEIVAVRAEYIESKNLDDELFGEEFES